MSLCFQHHCEVFCRSPGSLVITHDRKCQVKSLYPLKVLTLLRFRIIKVTKIIINIPKPYQQQSSRWHTRVWSFMTKNITLEQLPISVLQRSWLLHIYLLPFHLVWCVCLHGQTLDAGARASKQITAVIEPCDWHERRYQHPCLLSQVACSWCNTIKLSLLGGFCVLVSRVRVQWPETVTGSREQNSPVWWWNALYIAALSAEQMDCVLCKCVSDI